MATEGAIPCTFTLIGTSTVVHEKAPLTPAEVAKYRSGGQLPHEFNSWLNETLLDIQAVWAESRAAMPPQLRTCGTCRAVCIAADETFSWHYKLKLETKRDAFSVDLYMFFYCGVPACLAAGEANIRATLVLSCFVCHATATPDKPFLQCTRCQSVAYCSTQCQRANWPHHRLVCAHQLPQ